MLFPCNWNHKPCSISASVVVTEIPTSNEDIKRVAVSRVIVAGHSVERAHSQRISIENEKFCSIPINNKKVRIAQI